MSRIDLIILLVYIRQVFLYWVIALSMERAIGCECEYDMLVVDSLEFYLE